MANFTNYQEGKAAMLMLETQQRDTGTKAAAANGDGSAGEPPSPVINVGGGGGSGSRFHQHLPPSNHLHLHHHLLSHHHPPKDHHYQLAPQHLSGESIAESAGRKASSSSLSQVHTAEEPAASSAASSTASSHVYAAVNVANTSDAVDDIRKCGYLRKQKHGHKRFFVLRAASHLGPSRLEYYDSEKKFRSCLRSAAAAAASGGAVAPSPPKRVIYLYQCFTVNKRADSKNKHLIALYTKDEYFAIVAENEQEQEDWYVAVSELMSEGKKGHVDSDDLDDGYGTVTPGTVFKEVWQVNVKPKGLGQTKNLTGVYRLCLSTKTIHLVKLNSETPCVNLQLMNIRRCGHSESFFFIEVGRSSSIGPGEIWMQVDDSVVAQNMHETILETMKALKAFAEFRPRSKSQSSGSNPMPFITTRRHLGNLPPSQTGLQRRSRTESVVGTPPSSKSSGASGYRFRTSSEGEGTMNRPFRSATGSLVHLNSARAHHGRQEGGGSSSGSGVATGNAGTSTGSGRYVRAIPGSSSTYHARSASLPVSHFPSTTSPVSVSSSSGHGSVSDTLTRPSSASICGSPSDGGFNSSDEYGSSPGDFRYFRVRSNTPDSLGNTPPIREENCLNDYMAMGWNREVFGTSGSSGNNSGGDTPRDESTSTTEDERFSSSSSLRRRTHSFSRPAGGATGGSGVAVYQKMTQTNFSLDEGSDVVLPFGSGLLRGGPSSSSSSLRSDYSSCSEHSQQSRPSTLSRTEAGSERPPLSSSASAKEDSGYMPMMCGVAASPRDTPPDYMPMQPSSHSHPISHSPQFHSPALGPRSAQLQSQSSTDSHGYMMMLPGGSGSSPSPGQASPSPHSSSSMTGASGSDSIAERPENGEYMDMSYCSSGGRKLSNEGSSGYYTPGTPEGTPKSYSPYFSLPRSYKAPTRERDEKEYGEYVPMSSPAKPVYSSVATASTSTPEKRGGGGSSTSTPSHPPPPYGAHHTTAAMADRRVVRPNRLPLGRRSFHGPLRVSEPSTASAGTSTSVPATVSSSEGPSSPGEYINIEFGDHYPHQQQPPAYPLSAQDEAPSLGSNEHRHSPHQDYMSVEVAADQQDSAGCLGKNQSPRPSLVAPWNPPSYIRPLASNPGALASPGVPAGGHWRSMGDDYTDMTFNLSRGERTQTSPTAMLQHLCVIEGRYGHASPSSISPPLPPSSPGRVPTQQLEPKVVRADPQGRRRHSSETFSSTSSSNSTPSGGGLPPSSSATHPTPANTTAPNGSYLTEGQASRWASSASFDSMWVSMEGLGDSTAHAPVRAMEMGPASGTSASSSSSGAGGGRMCRNMSVGYQNGLNYIALELREDGSNTGAMASGAGSSNGSSVAAGAGAVPLPENGAYASIDFTKSDGVTTTTKVHFLSLLHNKSH
ncbi:insulin receptor substrate 2-B isoform X1 [Sebastes umbrosus]|uniref:insulin receptor substrate 2-B isoform X1 n=1 Tax=Sebastes umbrosus TaxID=72105 RepID=UPI00189EEA3D|nr:insulin receptor substrate 2-B isoform X1 [Sebastes umbrosus]